jgi:hypothetical protein
LAGGGGGRKAATAEARERERERDLVLSHLIHREIDKIGKIDKIDKKRHKTTFSPLLCISS